MATKEKPMADKSDIDRIHARIDEQQKQNFETSKMLTSILVQLAEVNIIVKGWPKAEARPCIHFQKHIDDHKAISDFIAEARAVAFDAKEIKDYLHTEHKEIAAVIVEVKEHLREAAETKSLLRKEGFGMFFKIVLAVIGGLLLLGIGAYIQKSAEKSTTTTMSTTSHP